jgi:hypothetical protein
VKSMNIEITTAAIEGNVWGAQPPQLVLCEYDNGEIVKRVRIRMTPVEIEEIARNLWSLYEKYLKATRDIHGSLHRPEG